MATRAEDACILCLVRRGKTIGQREFLRPTGQSTIYCLRRDDILSEGEECIDTVLAILGRWFLLRRGMG